MTTHYYSCHYYITVDAADYVPISMVVGQYNDATRVQCFDVTIFDDPKPETDQMFFINFVPTDSRVNIRPLQKVSVTILDNDCKLKN